MHILPTSGDHDKTPKPTEHAAKKQESVFHYRMDELAKAGTAVHLAADVVEDEHQIAKLKKAEKLAKEVHAEAKPKGATPDAPKKPEDKKAAK